MAVEILSPAMYTPFVNKAGPVFGASIYIGDSGKNPKEFPQQTFAVLGDGTSVMLPSSRQTPVIKTGSGGVPVYNGNPVSKLITETDYSILIEDKKGQQIYFIASTTGSNQGDGSTVIDDFEQMSQAALDAFYAASAAAIANAGWNLLGNFAAGVLVENANDVLNYNDVLYRTTSPLPFTTDGATPDTDSHNWLAVSLQPIQQVARSLNVSDNDVIYDTDTATPIPSYIYAGSQQKTYSVPDAAQGSTIISLTTDQLETSTGTYTVYDVAIEFVTSSFQTETGLKDHAALIPVGSVTQILGRENAPFVARTGLTPNDLDILQSNTNSNIQFQFQSPKKPVSVMAVGAKGNGSADDLAAFQKAVDLSGGAIVIPKGKYYLSSSVFFNNLTDPSATFEDGAEIICDGNFNFIVGTRGILKFYQCSNPKVTNAVIDGAMRNSLVAPDPTEDGDAGIEYVECTGLCSTVKPNIRNVMTWGVIHVNCEDTEVIAPTFYNCILQSGVGHAGVKSAKVTDFDIQEVGLYGVEVETATVNGNKRAFVGNGTVSDSQKGVAVIGESYNTSVKSVTALRCKQGFSTTNTEGHVSLKGVNTNDCFFAAEFVEPKGLYCDLEQTRRTDTNDAFLRARSYDYILKVEGGYGFVQDNDVQRSTAQVGDVVEFIGGSQLTIQTIQEVTDPIFGRLQKILYNTSLDSSYVSKSFKSLFNMLETKYIVLHGGDLVTIKGESNFSDVVFESYGIHTNLSWSGVTANFANEYIRPATQGGSRSTGSMIIESKDCFQVTSLSNGNLNKFGDMEVATKNLSMTNTYTHNRFITGKWYITQIAINLTDDWVGVGTPVIRVDGNEQSFGGSAPWEVNYSYMSTANNPLVFNLVDTVGDGTVSGGSIRLKGFFVN